MKPNLHLMVFKGTNEIVRQRGNDQPILLDPDNCDIEAKVAMKSHALGAELDVMSVEQYESIFGVNFT